MAINDITPLDEAQFGAIGARYYTVAKNLSANGTGTSYVPAFRAGEPVFLTLGALSSAQLAAAFATGTSAKPVVATDFMAGIAISGAGAGSSETDTADGFVYVANLVPNVVYLGIPDTAATWNTQAKYNALVGSRVLMKMGTQIPPNYTILASDSSTSGLVIEPLDISKYPGKVAFSLRQGLNYTT